MPILELIELHGPPRIGSTLLPYPTYNRAMQPEMDPAEFVTKRMHGGLIKRVAVQYRLLFRFGYEWISEEDYGDLFTALKPGFVTLYPRTIKTGVDDPEADEPGMDVYLTGTLPLGHPLYTDGYDVQVELASTELYTIT